MPPAVCCCDSLPYSSACSVNPKRTQEVLGSRRLQADNSQLRSLIPSIMFACDITNSSQLCSPVELAYAQLWRRETTTLFLYNVQHHSYDAAFDFLFRCFFLFVGNSNLFSFSKGSAPMSNFREVDPRAGVQVTTKTTIF